MSYLNHNCDDENRKLPSMLEFLISDSKVHEAHLRIQYDWSLFRKNVNIKEKKNASTYMNIFKWPI